ncbi:MAG TPA: pitrilysin family protein [Syntrophorhabdaceae bacterium]|nr:pitrilysin family protein [Syntrophorhabdaceae bacterium]
MKGKPSHGGKPYKLCGRSKARWKTAFMTGLTVLLLLALVIPAYAKTPDSNPGIVRAVLNNGLKVVIVRNALAPVVTTMVNYMAGSVEAPEGFPGTAHAQEHMMFRGSPGLSADQLAAITAAMGGEFNADTQQTVTQYFLTVPSADLDVALRIEAIRMNGVLDSQKLWSEERGAIEQEVTRDYSSPEFIFYTKLLAEMFKGTPYEESPLGTVDSFNKTTGAMLKKFWETWYAPNNAILIVVGDVDPQKTLVQVKRRFERILPKKLPPKPVFHFKPVVPQAIRLTTDEAYGLIVIAFRFPGYNSPDYPACRIIADALSNERSALSDLVPQGKALFTGFSLDTMPDGGLGYAIAAFPRGADEDSLTKEMQHILADTMKDGLPDDLIEAAKRTRHVKAELAKNSIQGLAQSWSNALALQGRQSPEEVLHDIEKVSPEEVSRAASKYLDMEHSIVTILTPESSGQISSAKTHGPGVESFVPTHVKPVKLPLWAQKALRRLEIPKSTVNPVARTLPNGLKLIVLPESVSDTVSVYGSVRNNPGMETPGEKEGVDEVLDELFSYGTTTLDRVAFQKALDDIGAQESAGADFGLKVLAQQFERGVELLADNELHPRLPEEAFGTVKTQVSATVAGRLESPDYLTKKALVEALFPKGDPSLREATPKSVSTLSLDDVKQYYGRVFRPDVTTIVVIGRVRPDTARSVIEKYFGSWKATGQAPDTYPPPVPDNKPSTTDVPDKSRIQAQVTLAQTLSLTRSNPDYYALELGNHVLGGGFYATRFFRDLREETGLVYTVVSQFDVGVKRTVYRVLYGCDPGNAAKARAIVVRDLKQMQAEAVGSVELDRAKALLLREIPLSQSSVDRVAKKLLDLSNHLQPLDEPILAAKKYVALSAEEVKAAYVKWLRPDDLVEIVEGPPGR